MREMITWVYITLITGFTVLIIALILILIRKKCSHPTAPTDVFITDGERRRIQQNREVSFGEDSHHQNLHRQGSNKTSYHVFRQRKPFFSWSDHPSLVVHAVENGWPSFSFVLRSSDSHSGVVASTDHGNETNVEMSWEVFEESADYMQKIRVKSELCVIRAGLPLPGPQFGNASFPREAYFEIRILSDIENHLEMDKSGSETTKLIEDDFNAKDNFECLNQGSNIHSKRSKIELVKLGGKQEYEDEKILVAIGLTGGTQLPLKIPGSFLGSVGFNSTGSVYLDGRKLVAESKKDEWGRAGDVIGCGYNPSQKKVFFIVNSQLVYEIRCKSEEFGQPLYPTLAANTGVTVVVNLGQSPFRFEAANSHRTPNPCFITTDANASCGAPFYELDSKELFSMGRIDGKWKQHWSAARSSESNAGEYDHMSESDLFEIVAR